MRSRLEFNRSWKSSALDSRNEITVSISYSLLPEHHDDSVEQPSQGD
jgi:hypothetical protein